MLSVVIPTKDTCRLTLACLDSLRRGGEDDLELVVVDDASRDGTVEAVRRRFPGVRLLCNDVPQSFTAGVNRGIAAAAGDLVLLLNSDTEVDAGALARLRRAFDAEPRLGVAGAALRYPDGRPQWSAGTEPGLLWFWAKSSGAAACLSHLRAYRGLRRRRARTGEVHWVSGAAMTLRREVLDTVGAFDPRYRLYAQDLDLCLAARDAGWRVAVLPEVGVVHHHGATVTRETPEGTAERQDLELVWLDLLAWAEKRHGRRWAVRAGAAVRLGLHLRLAARRLAAPFTSPSRRSRWRRETPAYRRTLAGLQAARLQAAE